MFIINKKTNEKYKLCVLQVAFFSLKLDGIDFISSPYDFITSSQKIVESSTILAKYFSFSQIHLLGFQIYSFSHI